MLSAALAASVGAGASLGESAAGASATRSGGLHFWLVWKASFVKDRRPFALSSPVVVDLRGGPAVVAGDRAGHVYAVYLKPGPYGRAVVAWRVTTHSPDGPIGVDSPPSTSGGVVYFGVGDAGEFWPGGYEAVNPNGTTRWYQYSPNPGTDPQRDARVAAGLTVGSLQSRTAIVGPSLGQNTYAFNAGSGRRLRGFPWFQGDTNFATAAVADVEQNGQNQIIEGGNTSYGFAYATQYVEGGQIRILSEDGNGGNMNRPNRGLYCEYETDQGVDSSPAVGEIFNGHPGIVVGTSTERPGKAETDDVLAINRACHRKWVTRLDGATLSSPALADVMGDGRLQVLEGTEDGYVYALSSLTGRVDWRAHVRGEVIGGVVTADLGGGRQDVVVPSTHGAYVLDGRTGRLLATLESNVGLQNSPIVTEDPDGAIGITLAGYAPGPPWEHAVMEHFELVGSNGSNVTAPGAWPEFHHDPQLTGNANVPEADNLGVLTRSLPSARLGAPYVARLRAGGGSAPYAWARIGGSRPPGLRFSANGTWSGTPRRPGTYRVLLEVGDAHHTTVRKELIIRIAR
jgi:outer membrane protein assembly factor BamB